ncbi:MAG TPA: type II secretion system F family protein [Bacteroidia bacterium]|nr:type II secretion system F family protein [Bacteroidia bacterium]
MSKIDLNKLKSTPSSVVSKQTEEGTFDFLNKDIKFFGSGFSDKKKERFYSELAILFTSGVDIRSALELIEEEQTKEKDKLLFAQIKESIIAGAGLSAAIEKTGMFTAYEFYSIQIGEESGRLTEVLQELSIFFAKKIQQKRQLTSALSYPAVVFVASFGAIFFMMKFVVPMFSDVFKRFKGDLPYFTKLIIRLSHAFENYSFYFFIAFVILIVFLYSQRKTVWFRKASANVLLRTPIIGSMISKIYLARFCQSMNLLISAKTPLVTAIDLVKKMVGFYPIEISLESIQEDVMKGQPLHTSLAKFKIYNKRMISLIKVAEEVNQLDTMFSKLAKQYTDEVEHQTSILGSLIEPIMIIFLGLLVAIILVAMYLPLFQMGNMVG